MNTASVTRRQFLRLSAGVSLTTAFLSACAPTVAPAAPASNAGQASQPAAETTELHLWSMQYPPHDTAWKMLVDEYNAKKSDLHITLAPQSDWLTKYAAGLSAGTAGDLMSIHGAGAASFIATGQLLALTDTLGGMGTIKERFFPAVMDYYTYKGNVYGLPLHNNTPGIGFITNLDIWKKAGKEPPLTYKEWPQVWTDAKSLTERGSDNKITLAGLSMRNYHNIQYLCGAIYELGGKYLDEESGQWTLTSPEGVRSIKELFYDPIFTHEVDSADLPECFDGLAQGRMAMGGIWIDYIPYGKVAFPDATFGFTMRPGMDGKKPIVVGEGGWGLNVNAATKQAEKCFDFITYLNQDSVMIEWLKSQHSLPCVYSLLDHEWYKSDEAAFLQPALATVKDWVWMGPVGSKYAMDDLFLPALEDLSLGSITVDEMAQRLEKDLTEKVKSFREETGYSWS